MNRKLLLVLSTLVVAMLVLGAASALGAPGICNPADPDCVPLPTPTPDPGPTTSHRPVHLFVTDPGAGTVTDTLAPTGQISCGAGGDDCGQVYTATLTCNPDGDCTAAGPPETLVASGFPLPGYTPHFFACTSDAAGTTACTTGDPCDNGAGGCTLEMSQSWRVRLEWADTTAPTKPSISGPAKVGPAVHHFAGGGATDNTGVSAYRYFLDGVDQGVSASGFDVGSLSAGTHHVSARARDAAGNESPVSDDFAFAVDRSAAVAITSPAAGGHFKAAPTFGFTHDADTGEIVCQTLDAGSAVVHESSCSSSYTPQTGGDGDYSARVVFTDDVGNQATATRAFKLDTGDPNVVISSPTEGRHVKSPFTPAFTATDGGTVAATLLKACRLETDAAFGGCGARSVPDGPHTLSVRATDEAGNARVETVGFVADSTGPRVAVTSGPPDDAIITRSGASYAWTASDPTGPLAQTCRLDGGSPAPCSSPKTFSGLSEGSHTFTLAVTDALGNATVVSREVFVNAVRPSVAITSGPADGAVLRSKSATFGFTAAGGGAVSCSLDSETAFRPCSGASSDALGGLADGAHTFRVRVRDVSDDVAVASRAFAVATSTPGLKEIVKRFVNSSVTSGFNAFPRYTIFRQLVLRRVPAGATITVTCRGRRCPARSLRRHGRGTVRVAKFARRKLRVGTRLTIQVTKPGFIGKRFVFTIRKNKAPTLAISQIV